MPIFADFSNPRAATPACLLGSAIACLLLLWSPTAGATSYVPMTDAELARAAEAVAVVRVLDSGSLSPTGAVPATDYLLAVEETLLGRVDGERIRVRVPGGVNADGLAWRVFGAPRWSAGERLIVFLSRRGDGIWGLEQFLLGAFTERRHGDRALAVRDLSSARAVSVAGGAAVEEGSSAGPRSFPKFARWLRDLARGVERPVDYRLETESFSATGGRISDSYTYLLGDCGDGGLPTRWFTFDEGGSVAWRIGESGQPGMTGSPPGVAEFQTALELWNDHADSNVSLAYTGTTSLTQPVSTDTGVIAFDDPDDQITGIFNGSGVLAIGGPYFQCSPRLYQGQEFRPAVRGFIITQDGAGSYFGSAGGENGEEVFAHELGHTLGFGHTSEFGSLMLPNAHGDGRGAFLGSDDRAALVATYGAGGTGGDDPGTEEPEVPVTPANLEAQALSMTSILLTWNDLADDESFFAVEMAVGGFSSFQLLGSVGENATGAQINSLNPDTSYRFRVSACNGTGCSTPSNVAGADTLPEEEPDEEPDEQGNVPSPPDQLAGVAVSASEVLLTWRDNSNDETGFILEGAKEGGFFSELARVGADVEEASLGALEPETAYRFQVRAVNASGKSSPTEEVNLRTLSDLPPECLEPGVLCLQDGRFAVDVTWRNQHADGASGIGRPIGEVGESGTRKSGMFWFFNKDNVELVVKVLDGRALNGHFWVFYGGLSDVEYDLRVRDLVTGQEATYHNEPGELCGRGDTIALPDPGAASGTYVTATEPTLVPLAAPASLGAAACSPGDDRLCLADGRFQVKVRWNDQRSGNSGSGNVVTSTVGGDKSGFFWFFNPANVELVVKMIDGRALNGHFWFFYGALSDVKYEIEILDTVADETRSYVNQAGSICGRGDTAAF